MKAETLLKAKCYVTPDTGTVGVVIYGRSLEGRRKPRVEFFTGIIPFTNLNPKPLLKGWLGTTDNYYREALGVYAVVSYDRNTQEVTLRPAAESEVRRWLEEKLPERWRWMMEELVRQAT